MNAALRELGMKYSIFINKLKVNKIELDRKILSQLAVEHPEVFKKVVEKAEFFFYYFFFCKSNIIFFIMDPKNMNRKLILRKNLIELSELEIKYLGRNGLINDLLLSKIKDIPNEQKREYGQKVNELKTEIKKYIEIKKLNVSKKIPPKNFLIKQCRGKLIQKGSLHIVSLAIEEITKIFEKLVLSVSLIPEVD